METAKSSKTREHRAYSHRAGSVFAVCIIPLEVIASYLVFQYVMGDPANFIDGNPANNPLTGNYFGIIYKGGIIVPILMTLFLVVVTFALERLWTLHRARGRYNPARFVASVKRQIKALDLKAAKRECDRQRGCIANVIYAGLEKYEEMDGINGMLVEKRALALQKEVEEVGGMEMPMLEKNLSILSTVASIATLMGLFGTVLGMIKAFAALAHSGAPDAVALANGISEALVNTALGIGTSALAIVFYNYFTSRIDHMVYLTVEAGQAIVQTFNFHHEDPSEK